MTAHEDDSPPGSAKRAIAAVIVATAMLCGCGTAQKPSGSAAAAKPVAVAAASPAEDPPSPLGKDWIFTRVEGFTGTLPSPPPVAGFIMTGEGQRLTGSTACNRMGSGYELNVYDGTLRFTKLTNTRMMCDRIAADTEQAVLDAMLATDAFRIVDGKLELLSKGRMVARLSAP